MYKDKGFTLVEILLVLATLALLLPIFLLVATHTVNANNEARLRSGAVLLAEGIVESLLASGELPVSGQLPPYRWQWQTRTGATVPEGLVEIEVLVTWEYRGRQQQVQLVTYQQVGHE
ncbi:MAG: hypothetical protein GX033_06145 [Firmicutes bacterium]|nr:hypothetical protein [Bacillota bacterium]